MGIKAKKYLKRNAEKYRGSSEENKAKMRENLKKRIRESTKYQNMTPEQKSQLKEKLKNRIKSEKLRIKGKEYLKKNAEKYRGSSEENKAKMRENVKKRIRESTKYQNRTP